MIKLHTFNVAPNIPERLAFLQTLAANLWWSWQPQARHLFQCIHARAFKEMVNNPLRLLASLPQERLEELAKDDAFIQQLTQIEEAYQRGVLTSKHWTAHGSPFRCIAYFSLEFGLHESVRLYSGGLGILAGDHLKSASDLDLPIAGVGLLYREGYFSQRISGDGQQMEVYPENEVQFMPVRRALRPDGTPCTIAIPLPGCTLAAAVWRLDVGRIPLILLDTNIHENPPELRTVTGRLYGGDKTMRLQQELLLGVGGLRALAALGYDVAACHINEGHAAFMSIERIGALMRETGRDLETVHEYVRRTSVFTTHTPVPAGNETFEISLLRPYLEALAHEHPAGTVPVETTLAWGRAPSDQDAHELSMTILGLCCSYHSNGVAKLHGIVERAMWQHLWPRFPQDEVPISHVTNGVHIPTWISDDIRVLLDHALGGEWAHRPIDSEAECRIDAIPDEALWRVHVQTRTQLVRGARDHAERSLRFRCAPPQEFGFARAMLDPDALTIGFARRFATYKRATLILRDFQRLEKILTDAHRPVQIIFAGKAHPADMPGKELIHQVTQFAQSPGIRGKLIFLENYNINLARHLVQGVDIWLNTPRRPLEASGTSGMKACCNGAIHVSTVDGWWYEGYDPSCGWAIGDSAAVTDEECNDAMESQALYNLLETEIIPLFYDRPDGDIPNGWIRMMKASMKMALRHFSSHRMVLDYLAGAYEPALAAAAEFSPDNLALMVSAVEARRNMAEQWGKVRVGTPVANRDIATLHVGETFTVDTDVYMGGIDPANVSVEVYYGPLDASGKIVASQSLPMERVEGRGEGMYLYRQTVPCAATGRYGFTARALPASPGWRGRMPGFVAWAEEG